MLTVYCKQEPLNMLYSAQGYFDFQYEAEWLDDSLIKEMVLAVDKTEVISALQCISPVLGPMACTGLSGGAKGLILVAEDTDGYRNFCSTIWGANCVRWLARLSFQADFGIYLCHPLEFISGAERGTLAIKAQTEDGAILSTCREVWDYYASNSDNGEVGQGEV